MIQTQETEQFLLISRATRNWLRSEKPKFNPGLLESVYTLFGLNRIPVTNYPGQNSSNQGSSDSLEQLNIPNQSTGCH